MRITAVGDSDTRLKWATELAVKTPAIESLDLVSIDRGMAPSTRQLEELGYPFSHETLGRVDFHRSEQLANSEVVIACLVGSELALLQDLMRVQQARMQRPRRPILVTGYAGIVYEKYLEGFMWRLGADVICLNSKADLERFTDAAGELGFGTDSLMVSGYPIIGADVNKRTVERTQRVVFAVQPDVPSRRAEREYVLSRLVEHAKKFPDREVLVKLRARPDEVTTHNEKHHYEEMGRRMGQLPPNLGFVYGRMDEVLDESDLMLTISSTAAAEAWARGIPVGIISDFGVRESLGNHYFLGSKALVSFDELLAGDVPSVSESWLDSNGFTISDFSAVPNRIAELVRTQADQDEPLPWPERYYSAQRTPGAFETVRAAGRTRFLRRTGIRRVARIAHSYLDRLR